ncbi:MAG: helicase, partial [Sphingomicrobium sp.]
ALGSRREAQTRRLWAVCGLPDFRKVGAMHHARMVRRLFSYVGEGGHIPHEWFAAEVTRLDNVNGDIEALADRLAGVRSWSYIAHRADWLADPDKWAALTSAVEGRLSDALHERLTQRFVDRRTAVLVRDIGASGRDALPVTVAADGEVSVGPEPIGHLSGFDFRVDPNARLADKRLLLAAAERRLGDELDRRAMQLVDAPDSLFVLAPDDDGRIAVHWDTPFGDAHDRHILARLSPGRSLLEPALRTARPLDRLSAERRAMLRKHLEQWLERRIARDARPLLTLARAATDKASSPGVRAVAAMLTDAAGTLPRKSLMAAIGELSQDDRRALYKLGVRLGPLDIFLPALMKPAAHFIRAALLAVRLGQPMPILPAAGAAVLGADADPRGAALAYRRLNRQWLRIDLADRLAAHARQSRTNADAEPLDQQLATSLALEPATIDALMAEIGFARSGDAWKWRGRRHAQPQRPSPKGNPFAALSELNRR